MAGPLLIAAVRAAGATLLPSTANTARYSNACRRGTPRRVRARSAPRIADGLGRSVSGFARMSRCGCYPEQACAHPKWVMGRKISVDFRHGS